jgi:hypothetical protein
MTSRYDPGNEWNSREMAEATLQAAFCNYTYTLGPFVECDML